MNDKELAIWIAKGGKFTLCEPQKITRKMRVRNLGIKNQSSSKKGRAGVMGNKP